MNILIAKSGVQIKFGYNDISLGDALYMNLFKAYPQHHFYVITHNNLETVECPPNVHYIPRDVIIDIKKNEGSRCHEYKHVIYDYITSGTWKDVKFDLGIMFHSGGLNLACNDSHFCYIQRQLTIGWYCFSKIGMPYIVYCDDANALARGFPYDCHPPKLIISQMDDEIDYIEIVDKETVRDRIKQGTLWRDIKKEKPEMKTATVKVIYGECEKVPLLEK